jgi:protein-L-isoaspartate(D-aspartate) O-methyltransferase
MLRRSVTSFRRYVRPVAATILTPANTVNTTVFNVSAVGARAAGAAFVFTFPRGSCSDNAESLVAPAKSYEKGQAEKEKANAADMAYRTHASSNETLIGGLVAEGLVSDSRVEAALRAVDRGDFSADADEAYIDRPHAIGWDATISAPHMHAWALEKSLPALFAHQDGDDDSRVLRVLDVGSGSGYLCAVYHHLIKEAGRRSEVIGIDRVPELVQWSLTNMRKHNAALLTPTAGEGGFASVSLRVGDGWQHQVCQCHLTPFLVAPERVHTFYDHCAM